MDSGSLQRFEVLGENNDIFLYYPNSQLFYRSSTEWHTAEAAYPASWNTTEQ